MAAGTTFAEANDIGDFEASPYELNSWWDDQPQQYDDYGWWYKPLYWKWVPEATGWYSVDCLSSNFTDDGNWLPSAFYVQVVTEPDAGGSVTTLDQGWDQVAVEVTAGSTYYLIITCRYSNDALYAARVSAVAPWSDWITPDPVTVTVLDGLVRAGWKSDYGISRAFGGVYPADDPDAYDCAWNWGRKGHFAGGFGITQWWSATGAGTGPPPGVCMVMTGHPEMQATSDTFPKFSIVADNVDAGGHQDLSVGVVGIKYDLDPAGIPVKSNGSIVYTPDVTAREFEGGAVNAGVSEVVVTLTSTDSTAKVLPLYPSWPVGASTWGPYLKTVSGSLLPALAGGPEGPESAGTWSDYVAGETFTIDLAALQASHDAAVAAGVVDTAPGWMLLALPSEALSSALPAGLVQGPGHSLSRGTNAEASLDVTYQPARYRTVTVTPPDLQPPALGAPPCQIYPRDDNQGAGSAAVWPPPSSSRPGSYY